MPVKRGRGRPPFDDVLTPAEWRTVQAVRHGLSNAEIARRRGVRLDLVKRHVASAVAKSGVENRRALRTWNGVPKASTLRRKERNMSETGTVTGVGQIARTVSDLAKSEAWYRDSLGLRHLFTAGTMAFFDCGGVRLMLSQQETLAPESIIYFRVDDIRAAHEALQASGVAIISAPHLIHTHEDGTEEWMMFFKDPDDRPLGLMG